MSFGPKALTAFRAAQATMGGTAVYKRGGQQIAALPVLPGRKDYQVADSQGVTTTWSSHDFAAAAEDLVIAGNRIEPQRGDLIERTVGTRKHTFEVNFPDRSQKPFRWSDPDGMVLRIHSDFVKDEAA